MPFIPQRAFSPPIWRLRLFLLSEQSDTSASILNTVVEWEADLRDGISSYKDGEAAAARGEQDEILLALETLADIPC